MIMRRNYLIDPLPITHAHMDIKVSLLSDAVEKESCTISRTSYLELAIYVNAVTLER